MPHYANKDTVLTSRFVKEGKWDHDLFPSTEIHATTLAHSLILLLKGSRPKKSTHISGAIGPEVIKRKLHILKTKALKKFAH